MTGRTASAWLEGRPRRRWVGLETSFALAAPRPLVFSRVRGQRGQERPGRLQPERGHGARRRQRGRPYNHLYGRTADVRTWLPTDTSYHSLQTKLDRRFRNGFLLTTSYTLSRAENYSDDNGGIATPADVERSKGRAGFDRKHALAASLIWDVPFFRGRSDALHWVLGGWQVSGIATAYSGTPINFTANAATLRAPGNTQRPNLSGDPRVIGDIGPGQFYFDTSVFSAADQNSWGNMRRNDSISGPGFWNVDLSLVKRLRFAKRVSVELPADAFDAFNHANFGNPNGTPGQRSIRTGDGHGGRLPSTARPLRRPGVVLVL